MADSQRKTANLWDENMSDISSSVTYKSLYVGDNTVTMSSNIPQTSQGYANLFLKRGRADSGATTGDNGVWDGNPRTFEPIGGYVTVAYRNANGVNPQDYDIMLNVGSTALPYEPYGWQHSLRKLTTATEAVENPLYSDGTAITSYTIKGNTVQNGIPTPSNPVDVNGVGTLDSGQYKIPISNGQQTTNIYLGSTQTTRQIEKITFDGSDDEDWSLERVNSYGIANFRLPNAIRSLKLGSLNWLSNRFVSQSSLISQTETEGILLNPELLCYIRIDSTTASTSTAFKQWLSENPVDLYYVLATPETAAVNEPLQKICTYADTLSNATAIPTTEGANSITVDTTVQPSEFTATWAGWHDSSVKEWDGSDWQ